MPESFYSYEHLSQHLVPQLTAHSSTPVSSEEINPLISRFLTKCPGSYIASFGGHSVLLATPDGIAVKLGFKLDDERMHHEHNVFNKLEKNPSAHLVRCYFSHPDAIFMPFISGSNLRDHMETESKGSGVVKRPVLAWMLQLASALTALETAGFGHGDVNPFNIIVDDLNCLKLIDLDHSLPIGSDLDVGDYPYVRLNDSIRGGQFGEVGAKTDQFAFGSIFWYITRGKELYAEIDGHTAVIRTSKNEFPKMQSLSPIDDIIGKCWHGKIKKMLDLLREIETVIASAKGLEYDIPRVDLMSEQEFLAIKKSCKRSYALLSEDDVTSPDPTSASKPANINDVIKSILTSHKLTACKGSLTPFLIALTTVSAMAVFATFF